MTKTVTTTSIADLERELAEIDAENSVLREWRYEADCRREHCGQERSVYTDYYDRKFGLHHKVSAAQREAAWSKLVTFDDDMARLTRAIAAYDRGITKLAARREQIAAEMAALRQPVTVSE